MKVILFGATGMVGQGVLRECLLDAGVRRCWRSGAARPGVQHAKLREVAARRFHGFLEDRIRLGGL